MVAVFSFGLKSNNIRTNKIQNSSLLSGFLDESIFSSDDLVEAAIEFIEDLSPIAKDVCIPHHVDRVKLTNYVEYNGEY